MTEEIYYHVSSQAAYHVWNVFGFQEKFLFFIGSLILIYFIDPPKTNMKQDCVLFCEQLIPLTKIRHLAKDEWKTRFVQYLFIGD